MTSGFSAKAAFQNLIGWADQLQSRTTAVRVAIAAVAGLLLGIAGRVAMRVIALAAGLPPGASIGGTLEVVATGALIGFPAALLYMMARRRFLARIGILRGPIFGLLILSVLLLFPPPSAQSAARAVDEIAVPLVAFGGAFVLFGIALELLVRRMEDASHPMPLHDPQA